METYQHYLVWKSFNTKIYHKTLTDENVLNKGNEKYIDTVYCVTKNENNTYDVKEDRIINTKCIFLEKKGIKYILPSLHHKSLPLNAKVSFDCYLKQSDKTIFKFIEVPTIAKITPKRTLPFKSLIQAFNPMTHTDPRTWDFLRIQAIASKSKGGKYRLCSTTETGKTSNDTVLHLITNDNRSIGKPTLAKLETLYYFNQKVLPDEMTSLTTSEVRAVEPFFIKLADESPSFEKHSLAKCVDMNEVDISMASCVFTYNDPACLQENTKFFDDIWKNPGAINSRYPALYLEGKITSVMPKLNIQQADKLMNLNYDKLRVLSKNIVYYIQNMSKEMHGYDRSLLKMKCRHKLNFEAVIDGIDVYSESQIEFNEWMLWINKRVDAYQDLIKNKDGYKQEIPEESV